MGAVVVKEANQSFESIALAIQEASRNVEEVSRAMEAMTSNGNNVLANLNSIQEIFTKVSAKKMI